jgi:hypothetical protein
MRCVVLRAVSLSDAKAEQTNLRYFTVGHCSTASEIEPFKMTFENVADASQG